LIKLYLEDFGPFERADLELKPLTIFIGRNSVGKSILSYLLWALSSAEVKFEVIKIDDWRPVEEVAKRMVKEIAEKKLSKEDFKYLVKTFCENMLSKAARAGLEERLKYAFGVEPRELIRVGKDRAIIEVRGVHAKVKASIADKFNVDELDLHLRGCLAEHGNRDA